MKGITTFVFGLFVVVIGLVLFMAAPVALAQGGDTVLFQADFEDGNLRDWAAVNADASSAAIVNDGGNSVFRLGSTSGATIVATASGADWTDYTVEAQVKIVRAAPSNSAGDIFLDVRATFADSGYSSYSAYISAVNDRAGIGVVINDSWIDALSGAAGRITINTGVWYTVRAEVRGNRIEWYVGDTLASWVEDRQISSGRVSLFVSSGAEVYIDNVRVTTDVPGAVGLPTSTAALPTQAPLATPTTAATITQVPLPTEAPLATATSDAASAIFGSQQTATPTATTAVAQAGNGPAIAFESGFDDGDLSSWISTNADLLEIADDAGNNVLRITGDGETVIATLDGEDLWTDFVIETRVKIVQAAPTSSAGDLFIDIRANFGESYNSYSGYISAANDRAGIGVVLDNSWQDALSGAASRINIAAGVWYDLRAEARGERIEWYVGDTLASWVEDSQIASGSFAFFVADGAEVFFDDVRITDLTAPAVATAPSPTPGAGAPEATATKEDTPAGPASLSGLSGVTATPTGAATGEVVETEEVAAASPTPTATATVPLDFSCMVDPFQNVNMRSGPGTGYRTVGTLEVGTNATVDGQAIGTDGVVWWRIQAETDTWVRSDTVRETGNCEDAPTLTELMDGSAIISGQQGSGGSSSGGSSGGGGGGVVIITDPPSGTELRGGGSHSVSWQGVPGASGYRVIVASDNGANPYNAVYQAGGSTSINIDIGGMPTRPEGWGYNIRVEAIDGSGGVMASGSVYVIRR